MATPQEKINELDKRIGELAGEIRFNENLLLRSESVLSELVELNAECKSRNDVQDERMIRILEELQHNHKDIDELKKATIESQHKTVEALNHHDLKNQKRFDSLEMRLRVLENWRWILLGAFSVIAWLSKYIDLSSIMG